MTKLGTKRGKDLSLLLEPGALAALEIAEDTPLEIHTDGRSIIISPAGDALQGQAFAQAVADLHAQYGDMLKRLA